MQLATWNVNSLNVRLPQVLAWLATNPVDVLALQELKLTDDKFPVQAFTDAGYHAQWFGQKTYNGVALLSKAPAADVIKNIPGFDDEQSRVLCATIDGVRVIGAYFPNGAVTHRRLSSGRRTALGGSSQPGRLRRAGYPVRPA